MANGIYGGMGFAVNTNPQPVPVSHAGDTLPKINTIDVYSRPDRGTTPVATAAAEPPDYAARDAAVAMFMNAGLGPEFAQQLVGIIDGLYASNANPTDAEVLNVVYNSEPYKKRFAGNEVIRQRLASGKARPGDRMLSPKEYIDAENSYRQVFQDANMPSGFWDSTDDFANLIANGVSVSEVKGRVDTAFQALNQADQYAKDALQNDYGLSTGDLVAYLLDPSKAAPLLEGRKIGTNDYGLNNAQDLQNIYSYADVSSDATRQGLQSDKALSEEIVNSGQMNKAKDELGNAGAVDGDLTRLGKLYGTQLDYRDLVREDLNLSGGVAAGQKRRKLASKERAAFDKQGSVDRQSLAQQRDV